MPRVGSSRTTSLERVTTAWIAGSRITRTDRYRWMTSSAVRAWVGALRRPRADGLRWGWSRLIGGPAWYNSADPYFTTHRQNAAEAAQVVPQVGRRCTQTATTVLRVPESARCAYALRPHRQESGSFRQACRVLGGLRGLAELGRATFPRQPPAGPDRPRLEGGGCALRVTATTIAWPPSTRN